MTKEGDPMASKGRHLASYPYFVEPPVQYAALRWTGSNLAEIQGYLGAHTIDAKAMIAGSNVLLIHPASGAPPSVTYQPGYFVVLRSDGASWRLDATRTSTTGLAPFGAFYVTPPT